MIRRLVFASVLGFIITAPASALTAGVLDGFGNLELVRIEAGALSHEAVSIAELHLEGSSITAAVTMADEGVVLGMQRSGVADREAASIVALSADGQVVSRLNRPRPVRALHRCEQVSPFLVEINDQQVLSLIDPLTGSVGGQRGLEQPLEHGQAFDCERLEGRAQPEGQELFGKARVSFDANGSRAGIVQVDHAEGGTNIVILRPDGVATTSILRLANTVHAPSLMAVSLRNGIFSTAVQFAGPDTRFQLLQVDLRNGSMLEAMPLPTGQRVLFVAG